MGMTDNYEESSWETSLNVNTYHDAPANRRFDYYSMDAKLQTLSKGLCVISILLIECPAE